MQSAYDSYVAFCKLIGVDPMPQNAWEDRTQSSIHGDHLKAAEHMGDRAAQKKRNRG
jgi:hypothetical protein